MLGRMGREAEFFIYGFGRGYEDGCMPIADGLRRMDVNRGMRNASSPNSLQGKVGKGRGMHCSHLNALILASGILPPK